MRLVSEDRQASNEPLVSIILTTLNSERFLVKSINSCLSQTYRNIELIIVDGGSTDRTLEIVSSYDDPRIRILHQENNLGRLPGALNLGMHDARGSYITWTQDDCWYETTAIEKMHGFLLRQPDVALVYCDFWFVDCDTEERNYFEVREPVFVAEDDVIQQCFLFRRSVYEVIGPQDEHFFPVHEIPWRLRVASRFRIAPLHQPLQFYGRHPGSLSGRIGGWALQRMVQEALYEDGWIDKSVLTQRLARIDIDEAYDAFVREADFRRFWACLGKGLRKKPSLALNWGMAKMCIASLFPTRREFQERLRSQWWREQELRQKELSDRCAGSVD